jgi:aspartyl-tRNA(Asn)/glutamyl-tRNA(Gln) amidotransferase subunit A
MPVGLGEHGLPIGLQLIGRPFEEAQLLRVAHALEQRLGQGGGDG